MHKATLLKFVRTFFLAAGVVVIAVSSAAADCTLQKGTGGKALISRPAMAKDPHGTATVSIANTVITLSDVFEDDEEDCVVEQKFTLDFFFRSAGAKPDDTFVFWDVRWDENAGRFFVYAASHNQTTGERVLYLATSVNGTDWVFIDQPIVKSAGLQGRKRELLCVGSATDQTAFFDAHVGLDHDRLYFAFDVYGPSSATGSLLDIDKASVLAGGPLKVKCFSGLPVFTIPPDVQNDVARGNSYFISSPVLGSTIKRFRLRIARNTEDDTMFAMPDITVPSFVNPPPAIQPNGSKLNTFFGIMRGPSIQIGKFLWNAHTIKDPNNHPKVQLYQFSADSNVPLLVHTISTIPSGRDDTLAPSVAVNDTEAFVTFTRTIASQPIKGRATLMMARGPRSSPTGWTTNGISRSPGQINKNSFGNPCDAFVGCVYGPTSATQIDTVNGVVWGVGEVITNGAVGGAGSEQNWVVKIGHIDLP